VIATISNILCWVLKINEFIPYPKELLDRLGFTSVPLFILLKYPKLFVLGSLAALGEELGWRGFMLPRMLEANSKRSYLWSALIWGMWHYPLILWGDYATSAMPPISLILFTFMILSSGVFIAWLRVESGSLWVAVFYHACHNIFLQSAFRPFTKYGPSDPILGNESGVIPCLLYFLIVLIGLKYRKSLLKNQQRVMT
jgi:membrane protease YdiL (CAAX protease family)